MRWRPDQFGEQVEIRGRLVGRDYRGRPEYAPGSVIDHCIVSPAGDQVVKGDGFVHGDVSRLQVLAPPGTRVSDGDVVVIRGVDYTVREIDSFDYSVGRRPAVPSHRPKVIFTVERGEVSSDVT